MSLLDKKCVPCEGGVPKLNLEEAEQLRQEIPTWQLKEEKLYKSFKFKTFMDSIGFVNRMAEVAEAENHHPNFGVDYNKVNVTIWTHAVGGLSENDFILAAKLDGVA